VVSKSRAWRKRTTPEKHPQSFQKIETTRKGNPPGGGVCLDQNANGMAQNLEIISKKLSLLGLGEPEFSWNT